MASSSLTDHLVSDSDIELSGGYSDGNRATTNSQNLNVPKSPPPESVPMVGVQEPVQTPTTTHGGDTTASSTAAACSSPTGTRHSIAAAASSSPTGPFKFGKKYLILAFEVALALINIRFQALGNSSSTMLLSSFLVTMIAATTVFAFTSMLIGLMLEKIHPVVATICTYAGLISVVLGFFFMVATFIPERLVWLVWAAGGVLVLVLAYSLARRTYNTSASTPSSV